MYGFTPQLTNALKLPTSRKKDAPKSFFFSTKAIGKGNKKTSKKNVPTIPIKSLPIITNTPTITNQTEEGVDLSLGIEQFSGKDRDNIEYALVSGDYTNLTAGQQAWIQEQAIKKEQEIQQDLTEEQALALSQAEAMAEAERLALQQEEAIKKQKMKQYAIYGSVTLIGLGLIFYATRK